MKFKSVKLRVLCLSGMTLIASTAFCGVKSDSTAVALKAGRVRATGKKTMLVGEQSPEKKLQSSSTASGDHFLHRPAFQMENSFYGVLPGLTINLNNGLPSSQLSMYLRGKSPLIMVDGIIRSDANIPASQIESITVVKDGLGLSFLGMSSGNGILNITTKRGQSSKLNIEFTAQMAFSKELFRAKQLNAYNYANLLNEARVNDRLTPLYSDNDLKLYQTGSKPYTHPNIDWMKQILKESAPIQQYDMTFNGGSKSARYFVDLNYYNQEGFIKQDKSINKYSTSNSYKKFSLRTNLDIELTPTTLLQTNFFGQMFRETATGKGASDIYKALNATPSNAYPVQNPDNTLGGSAQYMNNITGQTLYSGYIYYPKSDLNIDISLTQKFKGVLEGMYIKGSYSYNSSQRESLDRSKTFGVSNFWQDSLDLSAPTAANYTVLANSTLQKNATTYSRQNRLLVGSVDLGYDFNIDQHAFNTKLSGSYSNYLLMGTNLPFINKTAGFTTTYNYDQRFLAELALNASESSQYKPGKRWGFFPAAGMGWVLSNEEWFKEKLSVFNLFKLRSSYGINGDNGAAEYYRAATGAGSDYYNYIKSYTTESGDIFTGGTTPIDNNYLIESTLPYVSTWDHINRFTLGLDMALINNKLRAEVEFFNSEFSKLSQARLSNNSTIYGVTLPSENLGKNRISGVELNVNFDDSFGDIKVFGNVNTTFMKTKIIYNSEPTYPESYMQREGKISTTYGYVAEGLFQNQTEVDAYLTNCKVDGYTPKPGDIRYADLNNDKIIDGRDVKAIGTTKPRIDFGLMMGVDYKGLELSMQWSGSANVQTTIKDMPFGVSSTNAYGPALEKHLNRWTPATPDADYPRLSATGNAYNERTSTFWLKNADYIRLNNIQLSYTLPRTWAKALFLSDIKVFGNACNLLTLSSLKDVDPELLSNYGSTLPNIQSFNAGISVKF